MSKPGAGSQPAAATATVIIADSRSSAASSSAAHDVRRVALSAASTPIRVARGLGCARRATQDNRTVAAARTGEGAEDHTDDDASKSKAAEEEEEHFAPSQGLTTARAPHRLLLL